jgi:hypothetical protein
VPNRLNFAHLTTISPRLLGAHSAVILAENQVDPGESMKHEDHVLYLLDVDEDKGHG